MTNKMALLNIYAKDIIENEEVQSMQKYIQHGKVTTFEHCITVAFLSLIFVEKLGIKVDKRSLVRGAILHDFFLYDWHTYSTPTNFHGFRHPKTALMNAEKYFELNEKERDIIKKHMWPMTIILPKYKEAIIVCMVDKYCAMLETFSRWNIRRNV